MTRPSAGMRPPGLRRTTSPGTIWSAVVSDGTAASQDGGSKRHRLLESLGRPPGAVLLHEVQCHAERDYECDDYEARDVSCERGDRRGREQENDQRIAEPGEELQHDRPLAAGPQNVRAVDRDASGGLGLVETRTVGAEFGQERREAGLPEHRVVVGGGLAHLLVAVTKRGSRRDGVSNMLLARPIPSPPPDMTASLPPPQAFSESLRITRRPVPPCAPIVERDAHKSPSSRQ